MANYKIGTTYVANNKNPIQTQKSNKHHNKQKVNSNSVQLNSVQFNSTHIYSVAGLTAQVPIVKSAQNITQIHTHKRNTEHTQPKQHGSSQKAANCVKNHKP